MRKKHKSVDFAKLLSKKRVPIAILDEHWHQLFEKEGKTIRIIEMERKLGELMKKQGKLVNDVKDMKAAKHQLLEGIMANMNVDSSPSGKLKERKMVKSQKLVQDINDRLREADNDLEEIPYKIKEVNNLLVVEGLNYCYEKINENSDEIEELNEKINSMREELKRMIVKKQEMEEENSTIYKYMHDMLGSEIMELFDSTNFKK